MSFLWSVLCESGSTALWKTLRTELGRPVISKCENISDMKKVLDARGVPYQSYELKSAIDVTECFVEGDEIGEEVLDFITETVDFSKTASPELKQKVLKLLRDPQWSVEKEGRVLFNNDIAAIVLDALS